MNQLSKSYNSIINDQTVIKAVFPRKTAEWLAYMMHIPLRTARHWTDKAIPTYRREELGNRLLEEFDRDIELRIKKIRPAILQMSGRRNSALDTTERRVAGDHYE